MRLFGACDRSHKELLVLDNVALEALFLLHTTIDNVRYDEVVLCFEGVNKARNHSGFTFLYHYLQYVQQAKEPYGYTQYTEHYTKKKPFDHYKIPTSRRTKKKAVEKADFIKIRDVHYNTGSPVWHAKNYALVMFNCRGINFVDLVKLKISDIHQDRIFYGHSKTGDQLSVRITEELSEILGYYTAGKAEDDYLFPANYDGSTKHYEKYKTLRRRMNGHLKTIAMDAGIEENFSTYTILHSWATIAKYMGVPTEVISEGLGHNSLKTTQVYLKSFTNHVFDEANELVVS